MVAVALVAALLGLFHYISELRRRSAEYAQVAFFWRSAAADFERQLAKSPQSRRFRHMQAYFEQLRLKYERAARYPWLSVEPDPPSPDMGRSPFDLDPGEDDATP
jgi:hypothetical protein